MISLAYLFVGIAIGFSFAVVVLFGHAWRKGWRDYRSTEASAMHRDADDEPLF